MGVAPSYGGHSPEGTRLNWAAPAGGMLFSRLKGEVFLHGQGSYMGRSFCAVVTGPEEAAGQTVDVKGHAVSLKPGKCSPLMMGGKPFLEQKPKDMQTSNDSVVHWDGKVWSI